MTAHEIFIIANLILFCTLTIKILAKMRYRTSIKILIWTYYSKLYYLSLVSIKISLKNSNNKSANGLKRNSEFMIK